MNWKKLIVFTIVSLLFVFPQSLNAQQKYEIHYIDGREFYMHIVKRGETLFAIGRQYNIDVKEIVIWNKAASQGIKRGQKLKIPIMTDLNSENELIEMPSEFIYHVVEKHPSLFKIAQTYDVDVELITRYNPEVRTGIKAGQVLRIPIELSVLEKGEEKYIYYKVGAHETMFYLAQKYNVQVQAIYDANPDVKAEGLKAGMTIKIPDTKRIENHGLMVVPEGNNLPFSDSIFFVEQIRNNCEVYHYDKISDTLRIALMLPLYLDYNKYDSLSYSGFRYYKDSKRFFDIYKGVLSSLAHLKEQMNIKLFVYDTENNASKVVSILGRSELRSVDLIIGPIYTKNIQLVSKYADLHKINMISVLAKNNKILNNNSRIFQVNPSNEIRIAQASLYLSNFYDSSIVVMHTGSLKEHDFIQFYRQKLSEAFRMSNALNKIVFKEVNYKEYGVGAIEDALSLGLRNMVIIPSTQEADVMEMLTKLDYLANFYDITVYGMPEWEVFDNVELDLFSRLKTHYPTATYIDYKNQDVKNFIEKYRLNFIAEPTIYSFLGYDISTYFLQLLKNHGRNFQNCLSEPDVSTYRNGLMSDFEFKARNINDGFENQGIFILEYQNDYTLKVNAGGLQKGYYLYRYEEE